MHTTMSTRQVAHVLGVSERSVRRAIATGILPAARDGTGYRISPLEMQQWAATRAATTHSPTATVPDSPLEVGLPPAPASPFVGRISELHHLLSLLENPEERLLTLTGPGGAGKTRLAIEVAALIKPRVRDGVRFVRLESVRDPALLPAAIAQGLELEEQPAGPVTPHLIQVLQSRQTLLILDNFEQILPGAPALAQILSGAPEVRMLVTSRAPLRIAGERQVALPPMRLPQGVITPESLLASDASRLFIERAQRQAPLPELDDDLAQTVTRICARMDALPLGIELAAATTRLFTLPQLLERLERRLPLLHDGLRDAPARHVDMRHAIAWSYDLLSPHEQALFCRLSVFVGGFTLDAAEAVGEQSSLRTASPPTGNLLARLLDHSLCQRIEGQSGAARYVMLETIREFGQEQLAATASNLQAQAAHAHYFLELLRDMLPLASVYGVRAPMERLAAEQGNLRLALEWLHAHGAPGEFVELTAALGLAWYPYRANREGQRWLEAALAHHASDSLQRARLLIGYGGVRFAQGNQDGVAALLDEAEDRLMTVDAPVECALIATLRGAMANRDGDFATAARDLDRALTRACQIPDPVLRAGMTGRILVNSAVTAREQEHVEAALRLMEDAHQHYATADFDLARALLLVTQGEVLQDAGDVSGALANWHCALVSVDRLGDPRMVADTFALAATASVSAGEADTALLLFGAAQAMRERESTGSSLSNIGRERAALAEARQTLGLERAGSLLNAGRSISQSEAIDLIGQLVKRSRPQRRPLTRRQREVLHLLGRGKTDQEVADTLFLSRRTVSWHVRAILDYFSATTREEAIRRARSDDLLPGQGS